MNSTCDDDDDEAFRELPRSHNYATFKFLVMVLEVLGGQSWLLKPVMSVSTLDAFSCQSFLKSKWSK